MSARPTKRRLPEDNIELLLPSFRDVVIELMDRMRDLGYDPLLFDGLRTPAEAARNAAKSTGIVGSMHLYGCAADIICGEHNWSCKDSGCKFFQRLGREAEALGLTWGGRFTKVDQPHVQGIPVAKQATMRRMGTGPSSALARDAIVRACLSRG